MMTLIRFVFAILFICSKCVEMMGQTVHSIYDTSPNTAPIQRAKAFAHWFVAHDFQTLHEATTVCEAFQIPLQEIAKSLRLPLVSQEQFTDFKYELIYFEKQDSIPMAKVGQALQLKNAEVAARWKREMDSKPQSLWLVQSEKRDQFYLEGSIPDKKKRIKTAVANPSSSFELGSGPLLSDGLKINKRAPIATAFRQVIYKKGKEKSTLELTDVSGSQLLLTFPEYKEFKPYVKSFFVTDQQIWENERTALTWEVWGCEKITIDQGIGEYPPAWQVMTAPESTITYTLRATNMAGSAEASVTIDVTRIVLASATLTLFQGLDSDGKEKATTVIAELVNIDDQIISTIQCGQGLAFEGDNTYWGPFNFPIEGDLTKKKLAHGKLRFRLESTSNEKWTFSPIVLLTYNDGTTARLYGFGNKTLDSIQREVVIPF